MAMKRKMASELEKHSQENHTAEASMEGTPKPIEGEAAPDNAETGAEGTPKPTEDEAAPDNAETGAEGTPKPTEDEAAPDKAETGAEGTPKPTEGEAAPDKAETGAEDAPKPTEGEAAPNKAEDTAKNDPKPAEGDDNPEGIFPMKKKKRIPLFFRIIFKCFGFLFVGIIAVVVFLVTANIIDNESFETTFYRMSSMKIENPMRIVVLSDLHCKEFGPRNADLIAEIVRLQPDMIAMVGDMMNEYQEDYSVIINLLNDLQELKIAPIFYSYGNHEKNTWYNISEKLDKDIKATGVHVYSDSFDTVQINGNTIVVGGLTTPAEYYYKWWASNFMSKYVAQDGFKLLLCHYPDYFLTIFNSANPLDADLALCGHTHGGLIRIPGFGAVYGPDQGFRPKLTEGIRNVGGCTVAVSRGLGGRAFPIRINNKPELVVVDVE